MKENITSSLNMGSSNKIRVNVYLNKKNKHICKYMFKTGLISSFFLDKENNKINIYFSFYYDKRLITHVKQMSNSGRNKYITYLQLKKMLLYRNHFLILSTSKGILNNKEAIIKNIGGELLFVIKC